MLTQECSPDLAVFQYIPRGDEKLETRPETFECVRSWGIICSRCKWNKRRVTPRVFASVRKRKKMCVNKKSRVCLAKDQGLDIVHVPSCAVFVARLVTANGAHLIVIVIVFIRVL